MNGGKSHIGTFSFWIFIPSNFKCLRQQNRPFVQSKNQGLLVWSIISCFFFPKQAYHDFHRDSFCCCCCWEMRVNRRVEFGSNASQSAHVNQKVRYFKDIPMSFFSANFILLRYSLMHYRNGFHPTCVSSFPTAEFLSLHPDDRIYFVPHPWLHWMGVVELGHWCL